MAIISKLRYSCLKIALHFAKEILSVFGQVFLVQLGFDLIKIALHFAREISYVFG